MSGMCHADISFIVLPITLNPPPVPTLHLAGSRMNLLTWHVYVILEGMGVRQVTRQPLLWSLPPDDPRRGLRAD